MALGTALTIASILARLGQGYFAGRDLESAQIEEKYGAESLTYNPVYEPPE